MSERVVVSADDGAVGSDDHSGAEPEGDRSSLLGSDRRAMWVGALVGAVVVVATALPRLDSQPLWLDEAYSLGVANQFATGVRNSGGTMVLYYALLWLWVRVSESTGWVRALSTVFAVLTMPVVAVVARRIGGRRLALIVPTLLALSWEFGLKATEARAYSLEILLATVGWYCVIRAVDSGTTGPAARPWWITLAIVAVLGVLAHGLFPLFVGSWLVALLLSPRPRQALLRFVPTLVVCCVALLLLFQFGIGTVGLWVPATTSVQVKVTVLRFTGTSRPASWTILVLLGLIVVKGAHRWWRARRLEDQQLAAWLSTLSSIWLLAPFVALLLLSEARHEFLDRYLSAIAPGVALSLGMAIILLCDRVRDVAGRRRPASGVGAGFLTVSVVALVLLGIGNVPPLLGQRFGQWDKATSMVAANARPGDGMLFFSDLTRPTFEASWARTAHTVVPVVVNEPRQLGQVKRVDRHDSLDWLDRRKVLSHPRIWLVTVGVDRELGAKVFVTRPPLTTNFRVEHAWNFGTAAGTVTILLYVRTSAVDPFPGLN